ncbi:Predicted oxidoreductase [Paenibacillus sp. UNCCL117]|uniref:aldo/keto reductase n=1 Tax=unclassified Paenibacillus TaxID=185978 RepID=UPI0008801DCE|nr:MULTISPECIES: aldo/keto reductase [unclassified Paenibacillus]SDD02571.1 Predicted oxidoreductase [Paenibacillus sp. cl123]SFW32466.1 Predicted oxidoreductase [Paenibacillus sp. UNCCL117]
MKQQPLSHWGIETSRLVLGCMGLGGEWNLNPYTQADVKKAEEAIEAAISAGITMFDHADIYRRGKAEAVFGEVLKSNPGLRDCMTIQSKCGIRFAEGAVPNHFDFSKEHILASVDGTLQRLGIETLDILLLHRPDPLMEPDEVAEAIQTLRASGKVRRFGVSNMNVSQIRFLQQASPEPFIVNQLEISLSKLDWLDQTVHVNQKAGTAVHFGDGLLEYCQTERIQLQAWGPLSKGLFTGNASPDAPGHVLATAGLVQQMAKDKETTPEAIVLGWMMRHPALIQPVIGTANAARIRACADAARQAELMTREEWYTLYVSARGKALP